jgi:prepilin-type N-terminal cleavage/methylation domain-containing protein
MRKKGFTLIELVAVVMIIGLITAFGVPSYTKAMERTNVKNAQNNLRTIQAAMETYRARAGTNDYWQTGGVVGTATINTNLGLNILLNNMAIYNCNSNTGWFMCYAERGQGAAGAFNYRGQSYGYSGYAVYVASDAPTTPTCTGACPPS